MRRIAIYGKGGIGKSTVAANLSAAWAASGRKVMQVGCDPKSDSTRTLTRGDKIATVLETMRGNDGFIALEDVVHLGTGGIRCVECGGPQPGLGCAGWGIIAAFRKLDELKAFETYSPDVVLYDILGDVVCGGFAMPMREGYAREIVVVTSGEPMALFAARNIIMAIDSFKDRGYARLRGVIQNSRHVKNEDALIDNLVKEAGTELIGRIPRDGIVQDCEERGMTVVEGAPESAQAGVYLDISGKLLD